MTTSENKGFDMFNMKAKVLDVFELDLSRQRSPQLRRPDSAFAYCQQNLAEKIRWRCASTSCRCDAAFYTDYSLRTFLSSQAPRHNRVCSESSPEIRKREAKHACKVGVNLAKERRRNRLPSDSIMDSDEEEAKVLPGVGSAPEDSSSIGRNSKS
jgi:hypothetical protein